MFRALLTLASIVLIASQASAQGLIGTWTSTKKGSRVNLILKADRSFKADFGNKCFGGLWRASKGQVHLRWYSPSSRQWSDETLKWNTNPSRLELSVQKGVRVVMCQSRAALFSQAIPRKSMKVKLLARPERLPATQR